jgi:ComF family protein
MLPAYVRAARSVAWVGTEGTGAAVVHALKYGGWTAAAAGMVERMTRLAWPPDVTEERALVVPVPLSSARLRERGYNQSALLARALGERWGVGVDECALERTRATRTQTRLTPGERLANVRGAFRATAGAPERVRGLHVVLVDDVVTTAATLNASAAALFAAGARIVSYVTFGRARTAGDPS